MGPLRERISTSGTRQSKNPNQKNREQTKQMWSGNGVYYWDRDKQDRSRTVKVEAGEPVLKTMLESQAWHSNTLARNVHQAETEIQLHTCTYP